jgi:hypothetical protein
MVDTVCGTLKSESMAKDEAGTGKFARRETEKNTQKF